MPASIRIAAPPGLPALVLQYLAHPADGDLAEALRAAVTVALSLPMRQHGAVRLPLVADPATVPLDRLEQMLRELSGALGFLLPQSWTEGELAHVQDRQLDYTAPATRGHHTRNALAFHSDRCDLNLLLYVRTTGSGGELSVVSYQLAAEQLRERDAAAWHTLFDGFPVDLREERIFPSLRWHWRPILWQHDGAVRGHYIRRFITDSQRHADCPRLTGAQLHALDSFDAVLEALRPAHAFNPAPGELLVLDNYRVMHARSAYSDAADADHGSAGRLALRTWVAPYTSEALPLALHPLAGSCTAGSFRGGVGQGEHYLGRLGSTQPVTTHHLESAT